MKIGNREIGKQHPGLIIAEIGTSHLGDKAKAYQLIYAAREAGADCVKFQLVFADEILHPLTGSVKLPGGTVDLYKRFKELEQSPEFYKALKEYSEKQGLIFLCTPFGIKSASLLKELGVNAMKIASPELNHFSLLNEVAGYEVPVILSTGVSGLKDIEQALSIIKQQAVLLHCITAYPAPEEEYNIALLPYLEGIFGVPVGISDHSLDPVLVPVLSRIHGACVIEKHLTISKKGSGLDDPIALNPGEFSKMVEYIRKFEREGKEKTYEWLEQQYGSKRIRLVMGNGIKKLAPSEKSNYKTTRRSVHAIKEIQQGEIFNKENTGVFRSERNLIPGLEPYFLSVITGKTAKKRIPAGQGISWDDIL